MESIAYIAIAVIAILLIVNSVVLIGLVRVVHDLQQGHGAAQGVVEGELAPSFAGLTLDGEPITSGELGRQLRVLLFVSPNCTACSTTLSELRLLNTRSHGNVIAICSGDQSACHELLADYLPGGLRVVVDETGQITGLYKIRALPTAVLIGPDNRVRSYGQPERATIEAAISGEAERPSTA